jgi:hypothetical protein
MYVACIFYSLLSRPTNRQSLYLVDRASFINSFHFFTNLIHLIFFLHLQSFVVFLCMFRTDRSIIRRIKCLITQAASGTVTLVVRGRWCYAPRHATHDRSTTQRMVREAACVIKHLILLMMDRLVRNMQRKTTKDCRCKKKIKCIKLVKK